MAFTSTDYMHRCMALKDLTDRLCNKEYDKQTFHRQAVHFLARAFPSYHTWNVGQVQQMVNGSTVHFKVGECATFGDKIEVNSVITPGDLGHDVLAENRVMAESASAAKSRPTLEADSMIVPGDLSHYVLASDSIMTESAAAELHTDVARLLRRDTGDTRGHVLFAPLSFQKRTVGIVQLISAKPSVDPSDLWWASLFANVLGCLLDDLVNMQSWLLANRLLLRMIPDGAVKALQTRENQRGVGSDPIFAQEHACVTVMFADIEGFTRLTSERRALETMEILHELYCKYDDICQSLHLYKVETIGDCFVVAAGLVRARTPSESALLCLVAASMFELAGNELLAASNVDMVKVRIGLHSGPLVSGVISKLRPRYNIYGDTVNVASRMESTATAGRVHVSAATMGLLPEVVRDLPWAKHDTEVKGKGVMETYSLNTKQLPGKVFFETILLLNTETP